MKGLIVAIVLVLLAFAIMSNANSTRLLAGEIRGLRRTCEGGQRIHYRDSVGKWYPAVHSVPKRE